MRSNYKRLGTYIKEVSVKNTDLSVETLLGVSIQKILIPSIANTIGSDMSKYKVIEKNQFAYGPVTSRNGDKISVALLKEYDKAIISQSYKVFEVLDEKELLPDYLMMWFTRPEFDRYARFMSHGSTRETFDWDDMCEVELPIPPIEEQRAIVAEYKTVTDRIQLNEQINAKLEETAQALYRHWFVDFEFPDENGKPYKSSGGKMVWNEEMEKEVPEGWDRLSFNDITDIGSSKRVYESEYASLGVPFYRGKEIIIKKKGQIINDKLFISEELYNEKKSQSGKPSVDDILLTAVGTLGISYLVEDEEFYFKDGNIIWLKNFASKAHTFFIYGLMQSQIFDQIISDITIGSTQKAITIKALSSYKILLPKLYELNKFQERFEPLQRKIQKNNRTNKSLHKLSSVLLSKMATNKSLQKASAI